MTAMQNVQVSVEQTGDTYACGTHESLLSGMLRLGRKGIQWAASTAAAASARCRCSKVRYAIWAP